MIAATGDRPAEFSPDFPAALVCWRSRAAVPPPRARSGVATGPFVATGPVATRGRLPPVPVPAGRLAAASSVAGTALRLTGATSGVSVTAVSVATAPGVTRSALVTHNIFPSRGRARHAPTLIRPGHHGGPIQRAGAGVREWVEATPGVGVASCVVFVRRRPTLPHTPVCSTIGAGRLNFRVRNGAGCFPPAMAAVTLSSCRTGPPGVRGGGCGSLLGNRIVDAQRLRSRGCFCGGGCVTTPRPISTGRLRALLPSTSGLSTQSSAGGLTRLSRWETSS